jgi:hypothetical protein
MAKDQCPECGKKPRQFPRKCYYHCHSEHAHCVIANLASYGNPEQKEYTKQAAIKWERMREYAVTNFPDEPDLKILVDK